MPHRKPVRRGVEAATITDVMPDQVAFAEFIRRIRAGDDQAAAEFVRQYEPLIRRAVRFRLEDARLRRVFDSMDVSQSVLASFFARAAVGMYDLDNPKQLVKLLATMTRNKVATAAQRQRCQRRDNRRTDWTRAIRECRGHRAVPERTTFRTGVAGADPGLPQRRRGDHRRAAPGGTVLGRDRHPVGWRRSSCAACSWPARSNAFRDKWAWSRGRFKCAMPTKPGISGEACWLITHPFRWLRRTED